MIQTDKLVECKRCGSDACYETEVNSKIKNYFCMGCGYMTNSLMKKDSEFFKDQFNNLPELYKELCGEDENGLIWFPSTTNVPEKGMVFMNGKNGEEAKWAAVKAIPIKEEEKEKYKGAKYKMDHENMVSFEETNFMEALSYIGVLPQ